MERTYKNPRLEARRQNRLNEQRLVALLRERKTKPDADVLADYKRAAWRYGSTVAPIADRPLERILRVVADQPKWLSDQSDRITDRANAVAMMAAYSAHWVRNPETWKPRTHNVDRQVAQLMRHLFAKYDVPGWLDAIWFEPPRRKDPRPAWFIHVGQGGNLRKAAGLPIPLTKMMAHHALNAAANLTPTQALRYGQAVALGVEPTAVRAVLGSRLGQGFGPAVQEAFWATVLSFFARHPMIDAEQIGPIIDYLREQKFGNGQHARIDGVARPVPAPQPGLSMTHRDPATLVAQVHAWHRQLNRARVRTGTHRATFETMAWPASGVRGLERCEGTPGNVRHFFVSELLSARALLEEGQAMRHCVSTYAWSCSQRRSAIFSVRQGSERLLTVEVNLARNAIVQVRGRLNAVATPAGERIVRIWAQHAVLQVEPHTFVRR